MSEHKDWQRTTAVSRIEEARRQSTDQPMNRLYLDAAAYVGASVSDVEKWWKGRQR